MAPGMVQAQTISARPKHFLMQVPGSSVDVTSIDWGPGASEHGQTLLAGLRVRVHRLPSNWPWFTSYPVTIRPVLMTQPWSCSLACLHSTPACVYLRVGTSDMAAHVGGDPLPVPQLRNSCPGGIMALQIPSFPDPLLFFTHCGLDDLGVALDGLQRPFPTQTFL